MKVKKLLACFLAICMMFSLTSTAIYAADTEIEHEHTYKQTVLRAATCTTKGIAKYTCDCGEYYYEQTNVQHTAPDDGVTETAPTCVEDGNRSYTCALCGEQIEELIPATGVHEYEETISDATCTENAKVGSFCKNCGEEDPDHPAEEVPDSALGHKPETKLLDADCVNNTREVTTCKICGETLEEHDLYVESDGTVGEPATGHTWSDWTTDVNEDGEASGTHTRTCEVCGETETADCSYEEEEVAATCAKGAYTVYTCPDCGYSYESEAGEDLDADNHGSEKEIALREANCQTGTNGIYKVVCADCGTLIRYKSVAAADAHNWEVTVTEEPTCTEAGKGTRTCTVCGETEEDYEIAALGHDFQWKTIEEATCKDGSEIQTCTICGETTGEARAIPATEEHEYEEKIIDATCTENAKVGSFCKNCGEEDPDHPAEEVADSALGHKPETKLLDADCVNNTREVTTCKVCGETLEEHDLYVESDGTVGEPATGHTWSDWTTDVNEDGEASGTHTHTCEICGETETDDCSYETETVAANCENPSGTVYRCSECGHSYTIFDEGEIDASAHVSTHEETLRNADCANKVQGIAKIVCDNCGKTVKYRSVPYEEAHVWGEEYANEDGTAVLRKCTMCGDVEELWKAPCEQGQHTPVSVPGTEPTCTEAGLTEGKVCSVCGETIVAQEEIPAAGHTEETVPGKEATCTETGLTEGKVCSVCGETIVAQEEIPATGHIEEAVPGKEATCTEAGLTEGKVCSVCGEILVAQEEIPAAGHTETVVAGYPATCTEAGLTDGSVCSVCGETIVAQEEIPAAGHTETTVAGYPATCTDAGLTDGSVCSVCGATIVAQETIPATGHSYEVSYKTDVTTGTGQAVYTCTICGDSYTITIG